MKPVDRIFALLAAIGLAVGVPVTVSHAQLAPAWAIALPLGAVFLGLFLISLLLHKEVASFDEEQSSRIEALGSELHPIRAEEHRMPLERSPTVVVK